MPGDALTPPRFGLFGKLPAHGDFVRRGDPALVAQIDDWITGELSRIAASDPHALDDRIAALPVWRFVVDLGPDRLAGVLMRSMDRVGRRFPLILFHAAPALPAGPADRWSIAAEAAADAAIVEGQDADRLFAALSAIALPPDPEAPPAPHGWWRDGIALGDTSAALPTGDAFDRLWPPAPTMAQSGS